MYITTYSKMLVIWDSYINKRRQGTQQFPCLQDYLECISKAQETNSLEEFQIYNNQETRMCILLISTYQYHILIQ